MNCFKEPIHDPKSTDTQAPATRHEPDPAGSPQPIRMLPAGGEDIRPAAGRAYYRENN